MKDLDAVQVDQLKQIAGYLREQRQEQGVSLEEIALKTYIPLRLLQALESGTVERLPEPVFIQGFIRRYADALGVDGWSLAKTFAIEPPTPEPRLSAPEPPRAVAAPMVEPVADRSEPMRILPVLPSHSKQTMTKVALPVGVGLVLLLGVGGIIAAINRTQPGSIATNTQQQTGRNNTDNTAATATAGTASNNASVTPTATITIAPSPAQPAVNGSPVTSPTPSASPSEATTDPNAPVSVAVNLKNGDSWMEVIVDGKSEFQGMLKKGEQRRWSGKSKIELISGNAGAVYISYNNGGEKLLGDLGAVKTVTFPVADTTTPAPTETTAN